MYNPWLGNSLKRTLTSTFPYDRVKFGAEESLCIIEDEFHHHRLDTHLHERGCAAKAGRLDLSGPETQQSTAQPISQLCTTETCPSSPSQKG